MKNIIKTGATCALVLLASAISAQARGDHHDDVALAAIGGFIGGVIVSEATHDHDHNQNQNYQVSYEYRNDGFDRGRNHDDQSFGRYNHGNCSCGGGYWKVIQRRVIVPGKVTWQIDHCGNRVRTFTRAHFEFVKERIWISGHSRECRFR